jgi:acetyl-CoA carboxylase carboxyl transferase subunit alpha
MAAKPPTKVLDFEEPIVELENKIAEVRDHLKAMNLDSSEELERLEKKAAEKRRSIFSHLSRWQRYQLAKHPDRPYTQDYLDRICASFLELHGDRRFADDKAVIGGMAEIDGQQVMIIGQQKGRDTKNKLLRNFGMMNPEGYRKAVRLMQLAEKFKRPVVTLIDTPGAYPGIGAEERGQAEAIARNLFEMARLKVPIISIVIGEGASGGALGIGVGDRLIMLENAWYSVISPEGCAAILWKSAEFAPQAADAMRITSSDLLELGVIDEIIAEPEGGAHRNYDAAATSVKESILRNLNELARQSPEELFAGRVEKYAKMGAWEDA